MGLLKSQPTTLLMKTTAAPYRTAQPQAGFEELAVEASPNPGQALSSPSPVQFHLLSTPTGLTADLHCWSTGQPYHLYWGAAPTGTAPMQVVPSLQVS